MLMITLQFPKEIEDSVYSSTVTQGESDPYVFQSCKVSLRADNTIIFENTQGNYRIENFYNKIMDIEDDVIEQIAKNSEKWFDSTLDPDTIKNDLFKRTIIVPRLFNKSYKMRFELDPDVKVYDTKQKPIDNYKEFIYNNDVTLLLQLKDVVITSQVAKLRMVVLQIMVHKKPEPKLTTFVIQDEPEEFEKLGLFKKKNKKTVGKTTERRIEKPVEDTTQIIKETETINKDPSKDEDKDETVKIVLSE